MSNRILIFELLLFFSSAVFAVDSGPSSTRLLQAKPLSRSKATTTCIDLKPGDTRLDCVNCKVKSLEDFAAIDGNRYVIAHYNYFWAPETGLKNCGFGTVLLRHVADANLEPLWGGISTAPPRDLERPKVVQTQFGNLIHISLCANGARQNDGLLLWHGGRLHELDTKSLENDIKGRLPTGLSLNKGGLHPNLEKMTVESELWRSGDANCCPSGGKVQATLSIQGDKLVVKSFSTNAGLSSR